MLNAGIQAAWNEGGNPTYAFMKASDKALASAFTGNATKYKEAEEKKLVVAISVYESDFGEVQLVPSRFMDNLRVLGIDPAVRGNRLASADGEQAAREDRPLRSPHGLCGVGRDCRKREGTLPNR
jgi:hypothetical protein